MCRSNELPGNHDLFGFAGIVVRFSRQIPSCDPRLVHDESLLLVSLKQGNSVSFRVFKFCYESDAIVADRIKNLPPMING